MKISATGNGDPHKMEKDYSIRENCQSTEIEAHDGAAYCMGRMNSDCWYLYTLDFPESRVISQPDQTLEILMSELDPAVMDQFYMKDGVTAKDVTRVSFMGLTESFVWVNNIHNLLFCMKRTSRFEALMILYIFLQSSKCRTVLSSPQKIEGFKRLDCQSAMFSDYNFVFTSFAKKEQQQQS
ncbi:S-adenosylmethionine decarboxylase proenzyme [Echinops telfairi]|uniref:S-adenosylmethionine decarboxylase proenzyme n=1 Tax=Echinops telfairi TaxID=9371 RepID=A0AC55DFQ3_ECHTE|nr:S-adenosylmethionine decarboxylase proenzyme [Echinops telfairi]